MEQFRKNRFLSNEFERNLGQKIFVTVKFSLKEEKLWVRQQQQQNNKNLVYSSPLFFLLQIMQQIKEHIKFIW